MKHTGSYNGPFDNVVIPKESEQTDWEVELGIVIGKDAHNVKAKDAYQYIAGYCVINDVSERFWQLKRGLQWDKGKGFPSFSPNWLIFSYYGRNSRPA